jgi:hypothetical protein
MSVRRALALADRLRAGRDGRRTSGARPAAVAALLAIAAACGDTGTEVGFPLEIRVELQQPERTLGTPHDFLVSARGRRLATLYIDFGDGRVDTVPTFGAQTATHALGHTYAGAGGFRVVGTIEDLHEGELSDSVTAHVQPLP